MEELIETVSESLVLAVPSVPVLVLVPAVAVEADMVALLDAAALPSSGPHKVCSLNLIAYLNIFGGKNSPSVINLTMGCI